MQAGAGGPASPLGPPCENVLAGLCRRLHFGGGLKWDGPANPAGPKQEACDHLQVSREARESASRTFLPSASTRRRLGADPLLAASPRTSTRRRRPSTPPRASTQRRRPSTPPRASTQRRRPLHSAFAFAGSGEPRVLRLHLFAVVVHHWGRRVRHSPHPRRGQGRQSPDLGHRWLGKVRAPDPSELCEAHRSPSSYLISDWSVR